MQDCQASTTDSQHVLCHGAADNDANSYVFGTVYLPHATAILTMVSSGYTSLCLSDEASLFSANSTFYMPGAASAVARSYPGNGLRTSSDTPGRNMRNPDIIFRACLHLPPRWHPQDIGANPQHTPLRAT